jgi:hypothetical protein
MVLLCIWSGSAALAAVLRSTKSSCSPSSYALLVLSLGLCFTKALGQWLPYADSTLFSLFLVGAAVVIYPTALLKQSKEGWHEAVIYLSSVLLVGLFLEMSKSLLFDASGSEGEKAVMRYLCIGAGLGAYAVMAILQGIGVMLYPEQTVQPLMAEYRLTAEFKAKYEEYQTQIRDLLLFYTYRGLQMPRFKEKQLNELTEKAESCSEEATSLLYKPQSERLALYLRILAGLSVSVLCGLLAGFYAIEAVARVVMSPCGLDCGYAYSLPWLSSLEGSSLLYIAAGMSVLQVVAAIAGLISLLSSRVCEETMYVSMAGTVAVCGLALPSALHNLFPRLHGVGHGGVVSTAECVIQCLPLGAVLVCTAMRACRKTTVLGY